MGNLLTLAPTLLSVVSSYLESRKADVAKATGLNVETVSQVSNVVSSYLTQDERATQAIMAEIDKARAHDDALNTPAMPPVITFLRGLVRPLITLTAFFWYVYARSFSIPLGAEDYAIIGGIMAFWFGFRPFEKATVANKHA